MSDTYDYLGDTPQWRVAMCTGHRSLPSPAAKWVRHELIRTAQKLRADHGTETAVTGMALGADTQWGYAGNGVDMKVWAHTPFLQQAQQWTSRQRDEWGYLRRLATQETVYGDLGDTEGDERKWLATRLLHARNDGMIEVTRAASGVVLAVWDGRQVGETWSVIEKLHPRGKAPLLPVIWLNPTARTVTLGIPEHRLLTRTTRTGEPL